MKYVKLIGLISSIILIINYFIIGPAISFISEANWFDTLSSINKTFVFPIAFIGFYFTIYKIIRQFEIKKLTIPVLIILGFGFISLILNLIRFLGINTPDVFNGSLGIVIMVVFILWAILVIRSKDGRFKRIKRFAIAMLVGYALIFIFTLINMFAVTLLYESGYQPFEYINIAYAIYGVGYVYGLLIFVEKLKKTNRKFHGH